MLLAVVSLAASMACLGMVVTGEGGAGGRYCVPGESCWPSAADVEALYTALDPSASRSLVYAGPGTPWPMSVPSDSPGNQPLYGANKDIPALTVQAPGVREFACFVNSYAPASCLMSTRNNPLQGWTPSFIAWPLTTAQVQSCVQFAVAHRLCIAVAGTGHDFLNRHTCDQGILIRTSLMKSVSWATDNSSITVGTGTVFSEAAAETTKRSRYIACGWAGTVGVVGWTIGGGHGPFTAHAGLGVDNLLGAEVVTATGEVVVANNKTNTDLYWALRGGGGSAWGVLTSVTLRTHVTPASGFTMAAALWAGDLCDIERVQAHLDAYFAWSLTLDTLWNGILWASSQSSTSSPCGATWSLLVTYAFLGGRNETAFTERWNNLTSQGSPLPLPDSIQSFRTFWDFENAILLQVVVPLPTLAPSNTSAGSDPSVLVSRERVESGEVTAAVLTGLQAWQRTPPIWLTAQLFHDLTGQRGSLQPSDVSISHGLRTAMIHYVIGLSEPSILEETYYPLGNNSYMNEAAYEMTNWTDRLWGDNYTELLKIKQRWDPNNTFWCRHCVGSEGITFDSVKTVPHTPPKTLSTGAIAGIAVGSVLAVVVLTTVVYLALRRDIATLGERKPILDQQARH